MTFFLESRHKEKIKKDLLLGSFMNLCGVVLSLGILLISFDLIFYKARPWVKIGLLSMGSFLVGVSLMLFLAGACNG